MSGKPIAVVGSLLLALLLAACGSSTGDRGASGIPTAPSPSASDTTVAPSPSPEVRIWGAGSAVSYPFDSFAGLAREAARGPMPGTGIALVRITDVSGVRWSTADGQRPGPADMRRVDQLEASLFIGRLVTVELDRMLRGTWPVDGSTVLYWLAGGQIGNDRTPSYAAQAGLAEPRPGALAVAWTWSGADIDEATDGVLRVNVNVLFPVDDVGRVRTEWPDETIMIGDIERYLPAP
jgi:hypothetical protein